MGHSDVIIKMERLFGFLIVTIIGIELFRMDIPLFFDDQYDDDYWDDAEDCECMRGKAEKVDIVPVSMIL